MISYNRQSISIDDIKSVSRALKELITRGGIVSSFENKISNFVNSKHAVTFNSASSALNHVFRLILIKTISFGQSQIHLFQQPHVLYLFSKN